MPPRSTSLCLHGCDTPDRAHRDCHRHGHGDCHPCPRAGTGPAGHCHAGPGCLRGDHRRTADRSHTPSGLDGGWETTSAVIGGTRFATHWSPMSTPTAGSSIASTNATSPPPSPSVSTTTAAAYPVTVNFGGGEDGEKPLKTATAQINRPVWDPWTSPASPSSTSRAGRRTTLRRPSYWATPSFSGPDSYAPALVPLRKTQRNLEHPAPPWTAEYRTHAPLVDAVR